MGPLSAVSLSLQKFQVRSRAPPPHGPDPPEHRGQIRRCHQAQLASAGPGPAGCRSCPLLLPVHLLPLTQPHPTGPRESPHPPCPCSTRSSTNPREGAASSHLAFLSLPLCRIPSRWGCLIGAPEPSWSLHWLGLGRGEKGGEVVFLQPPGRATLPTLLCPTLYPCPTSLVAGVVGLEVMGLQEH